MTVRDLINQLESLENDEIQVYVEADHGQTIEVCHGAVEMINADPENGYYIESYLPEDIPYAELGQWCLDPDEYAEIRNNNPRFCLVYA